MSGALGTLYGIGLGPGDPELITVKGWRLLRSAPVVYVPVARSGRGSYARTLAAAHVDPRRQRVVELEFAMRGGPDEMAARWRANAATMLDHLTSGQDAAFLTEGDPMLYSTFVHVVAALLDARPDLPVVVVPGISSAQAAAAATLTPLADRDERLAILPALYEGEGLRRVIETFDTVVLLKVSGDLDRIVDVLDDLRLAERAVFVERCGRTEQRIVRDVRSLRGQRVDYFSLIIVRRQPWARATSTSSAPDPGRPTSSPYAVEPSSSEPTSSCTPTP